MIRTLVPFIIFQVAFIKVYPQAENAAEGVQNISSGLPDRFTPYGFCAELPKKAAMEALPVDILPFSIVYINITINTIVNNYTALA